MDLSLIPPDPTEYMAAKQGKLIQKHVLFSILIEILNVHYKASMMQESIFFVFVRIFFYISLL